jgi:hypothetical protein
MKEKEKRREEKRREEKRSNRYACIEIEIY